MKKIRIQLHFALLMVPFLSNATTFVVTNTLDSGLGSLRQAIVNANLTADSRFIGIAMGGALGRAHH